MENITDTIIVSDIDLNIKNIDSSFTDCPDIIKNSLYLKDNSKVYYVYVDGLVDVEILHKNFFSSIILLKQEDFNNNFCPIYHSEKLRNINSIVTAVLNGNVVFLVNGLDYALSLPITKFEKREIREPEVEKNLRGSHEGFIEPLSVNKSILRRKIKNSNLKFKTFKIGSVTNQEIVIAYINGIANNDLLNTLYNKISAVNFDGIIGSGYIQQIISDFKYSIFPLYQATERPDKAVAALMEGQFVIMVDGTPVVLIAPVCFFAFFQAIDDYNTHWILGSFTRITRYFAAFLAILLPPIYIALSSFHYYMVPLDLLIPFAESRAKVPFPPIIEAFLMETIIELLRESAIRLPSYIGITIGVTGGIILGQATVQAGIVSNIFLIIIGVTALASYVSPSHDMAIAIRFTRIIFMLFSSIFGIIGIVFCSTFLFAHLVTIESLGQPYFQPLSPFKLNDLKDTIIRAPIELLKKRHNIAKPLKMFRGKGNE